MKKMISAIVVIVLIDLLCDRGGMDGMVMAQDLLLSKSVNILLEKDASNKERQKAYREIFNAGNKAIPVLLSALRPVLDNEKELYRRLSYLLWPIKITGGSQEALKLLKPYFTEGARINYMKAPLCMGLDGLADPECEAYFLNALERTPIEQAVYTFGVSRNKKYLPLFEKKVEVWIQSGSECSEPCEDMRRAIYWIKKGPLPPKQEVNDAQRVRQLIFEYMFLGDGEEKTWGIRFLGQEPQEFHGYGGQFAYLPPGEGESVLYSKLPKEGMALLEERKIEGIVTFGEVLFNPDQTRASASLGYYWGPRAGRGYEFLLEKIQGEWQFTLIWPSWRL